MNKIPLSSITITLVLLSLLIIGCRLSGSTPEPGNTLTTSPGDTPLPGTLTPTPIPPMLTFTQPPPTSTNPPTSTEMPSATRGAGVEFFDFENQEEALPPGFTTDIGAESSESIIWSTIEIDETVAHTGSKSLKLSGSLETGRWYLISRQIPTDVNQVWVTYYVKGNEIHPEGNQFKNCYLGFFFTSDSGQKTYEINRYNGTFDWAYGELWLDAYDMEKLREFNSKIHFVIFLSMSGEFWIDDLEIEMEQLTP